MRAHRLLLFADSRYIGAYAAHVSHASATLDTLPGVFCSNPRVTSEIEISLK